MNLNENAHIRQLLASAAATGIKLPPTVTAATERATRLSAAVRSINPPETALYEAIAAAVDNGTDPAADAEVQRVLAGRSLATEGVIRGTDTASAAATTAALYEHRDGVVQTWRKPFGTAAATLVKAYAVLGSVDLDDTATILQMGAHAADAWGDARKAITMIRSIGDGWTALANLHRVQLNPARAILRIAHVEPDRWADLDIGRADPWQAIAAGLTLSLPTLREYLDRCEAIDQHLSAPVTAVDTERSHVAGREIRRVVA